MRVQRWVRGAERTKSRQGRQNASPTARFLSSLAGLSPLCPARLTDKSVGYYFRSSLAELGKNLAPPGPRLFLGESRSLAAQSGVAAPALPPQYKMPRDPFVLRRQSAAATALSHARDASEHFRTSPFPASPHPALSPSHIRAAPQPGRAKENSPAFQRWVRGAGRTKSRQGRQNISHARTIFRSRCLAERSGAKRV